MNEKYVSDLVAGNEIWITEFRERKKIKKISNYRGHLNYLIIFETGDMLKFNFRSKFKVKE